METEPRRAFVTGCSGMIGSYCVEQLLDRGYVVHGMIRRASIIDHPRLDHVYADPRDPACMLFLHYGNVTDAARVRDLVREVRPHEVYHFAAMSHVRVSFDLPMETLDTITVGTQAVLEAVAREAPEARVWNQCSSEMFGDASPPQNEDTPFRPRSPYGAAKAFAFYSGRNFRERGLWVANGIVYNQEGPRRGETFVTRKITRALGRIKAGTQDIPLYLGNIDAFRDWGYAADGARAAVMALGLDAPGDWVVATGASHSVREFLDEAATVAGLDWRDHVEIDDRYLRPTEVPHLRGDASRFRAASGWAPTVTFKTLVRMMVEHDVALAEDEKARREGAEQLLDIEAGIASEGIG